MSKRLQKTIYINPKIWNKLEKFDYMKKYSIIEEALSDWIAKKENK